MREITSYSNSTIKQIRGLRSRKNRRQSGMFYIEGVRHVGEAIVNDFPLEYVIYSPELLTADYGQEILAIASIKNIDLIQVTSDIFNSLSMKEGPHGIAAVGHEKYFTFNDIEIKGLWIALENIQDPGNLGSIMRSLDGAGGKGVILIGDSTDPYHPTAVRSSTGAIFYLPILKSSITDFIGYKKRTNIFCAGSSCNANTSFKEVDYPDDVVLVMGSEQKGITGVLEGECDILVNIPMAGKVDSLNLANAASIVLFEIYTRRIKT